MIGGRMTIGDVARRTGVSIKALRFYDELGILQVAGRSESNYRIFGDSVLECVERIRAFQQVGLTLRQVQDLAQRARAGEDPAAILRQAYSAALARTERDIGSLEAKRARLRAILARDLTLPCAGGCSLDGENASRSDASNGGRHEDTRGHEDARSGAGPGSALERGRRTRLRVLSRTPAAPAPRAAAHGR